MEAFALTELGRRTVEVRHAELVALYSACYAAPPWNETQPDFDAYADRIRAWSALDGFAGVMLVDAADDLVGVTYGWQGPAEIRGVRLPGVDHPEVFNVADLMVRPAERGRGLGRSLLDALVEDRRPAALVTHTDSPARRLYDAAGWKAVGELTPPDSLTWIVYLRDADG